MNTVGTSPVPLTVFGGAVPEMAPEDLPEGASPFNQDCDYVPGAVFQRGGRQSVYGFTGLFVEDLAGFAITIPGLSAPNEAMWANPNNASKNIPGTYAVVPLNAGAVPPSGPGTLIQFIDNNTAATSENLGTLTPTAAGQFAVWVQVAGTSPVVSPGTQQFIGTGGSLYTAPVPSPTAFTSTFNSGLGYNGTGALFGSNGTFSVAQKTNNGQTGFPSGATITAGPLASGVPAIDAVILAFEGLSPVGIANLSVTDDKGNIYTLIAQTNKTSGTTSVTALWICVNPQGAPKNFKITNNGTSFGLSSQNFYALDIAGIASGVGVSQILQASNFNFNIPTNQAIVGAEVEISGNQTALNPDAILSVQLVQPNGTLGTRILTAQLPAADAQIVVGTPGESWGTTLTPATLNSPQFSVNIVASASGGEPVNFSIYAVKLKVFTAPSGSNFNYVKTYEQTSGQVDTLALDAAGVLWDENVTSAIGSLSSIYTGINAGSFAKSVTFEDVEYIAFSNLLQGTDIPRHWDGTNLDRVSQVGPGAPPSVSATATIFQIAPSPTGITQPTAKSDPEAPGRLSGILWSAGPGSTSLGNVLTVYYARTSAQAQDPDLQVGGGVFLTGIDVAGPANNFNGQPVNGTYIITSLGQGVPPGAEFARWYFTVQMPSTQSVNQANHQEGNGPFGTYNVTRATLTTLTPLPNVQVGSQIAITGAGVAAWNATWTVIATLNAAQMAITQTQLSGNIATYTFTLLSGVSPTVGQQVTIVGCLNGPIVGGTSIFNISNGIISSVGANQFSISITGPNVNPAAETGNATVNGTKFQIDPGIVFAGTATNPILGNSGGGTVVMGGAGLAAGTRKAVLMFLTRNGLITAPSPPVIFNTTGGTTSLAFSNLLIGPPDTIARIVALTGANGGNFFWIPTPTITTSGGQTVTYTSTVINDNTSTTAILTFTDAILLAATAIDIPGNNLFEQIELGSSRGFLTYANRLIAWGEQNKIQNLLNLSFDGGIGQTASGVTTYPAGWTVDPVNGAGGNLRVSPIFGNSYYVVNTTGGVQALYGMLTQPAFQDQFQVAIVQPNTKYSVRLAARCPSGVQTGALVVDFFSPLQNRIFGSFTVPLSSMTSNFQIFTGTLLTTAFTTVPADLLFRVYFTNLPNNGDGEVDRVEPFPTLQPVISTQFTASYAGNQEAFDQITGRFGPAQNQQPINGGFVQNELLYALKEKSMYSTSDNGVTEPFKWQFREVSPKVGTCGIHSYDAGEGWMVTACRPGAYFFEGGEPIKISQEIQPVWDLINWQNPAAAASVWVRNDEQLKRLTIGAPIPTPNPFMPEFPVNANPTQPNVILMCSYRELNTGQEMARTGPIRSTFSGRLMSPEPARKWSFWNIACPYADFVSRGGEEWREFFCSGYGNSKIFQLSSAELDDDGGAINSFYVTYGFVKPEMADAKGLGLFRMSLDYLTMLLIGSGTAKVQVYPESVLNSLPYQLEPVALQSFSQGDVEVGVLITGNRFFVRVGTNAVGSTWRLSKVVAALTKDPWAEVRGTQVGSA